MTNCESTSVQPVNNVRVNEVAHSGVVTHKCNQAQGHEGKCRCACGYHWQKFHTVK